MLAKANRIVRADDYRNTVRRGRKSATAHCVVYLRVVSADPSLSGALAPGRFGFIVAKNVGNAVVRNTVRRRLKAVAHTLLGDDDFPLERTDIVIRALPGSDAVQWSTLLEEITGAVNKGVRA
ncbi:ribonuclease P protein component [Frondihabitans sp. Leaf304]|uniref:ribonuclease P protein component n=1 Tax=Frondihabitans sp. Leaf304 TaxID=1736329 RepID=UPI000A0077E6|nr:ribonuclease P protein component [Frondihabitans sp. Leaf304]